jgi:hypothetical protein
MLGKVIFREDAVAYGLTMSIPVNVIFGRANPLKQEVSSIAKSSNEGQDYHQAKNG